MTTIPAPDGLAALVTYAMKRVPSADVRRRSRPPVEPPAMGVIGGRESLSTHMVALRRLFQLHLDPFGSQRELDARGGASQLHDHPILVPHRDGALARAHGRPRFGRGVVAREVRK